MPQVIRDMHVRQGGLMRCCIATLANHANERVEVGDTLACDYEGDEPKMVVARDGVWEWVGPGPNDELDRT